MLLVYNFYNSVIAYSMLFTKFTMFITDRHLTCFHFSICRNIAAVYIFSISHFLFRIIFLHVFPGLKWLNQREWLSKGMINLNHFLKISLKFTHLPPVNVFIHFTFLTNDIFPFFLKFVQWHILFVIGVSFFDFTYFSEVLPCLVDFKN